MLYEPLLIHSINYVGRLNNIPDDTLKRKNPARCRGTLSLEQKPLVKAGRRPAKSNSS